MKLSAPNSDEDELPQFWNVIKGVMSLVGPRPPVKREVECYDQSHRPRFLPVSRSSNSAANEQLWLAAPIGLVSLADAEAFGDEARVHASFYAAQAGPRLDRQILRRTFHRAWRGNLN